jgi:CPA2 family monovalent cation:H+ antiporter-2
VVSSHFLQELVIVLGVAAITTVVFQRLRQPVVLGYLVAGLIIGPYLPTGVVADARLVNTLSELGVILLMFSIGLEFSIRRIARVGAGAALTCAIEVGLMLSLGFLAGKLLGFSTRESLFLGAALAISSTMLVARAFEDHRPPEALKALVFAVLVFEDMFAILLLALLTGVAGGRGLDGPALATATGKLVGFLILLLAGGLFLVPRFIRLVARFERPETLLIGAMAVCFAMALLAEKAGYSVALGAFLAGMLVSESGHGAKVEQLVAPFRDVFAAIFFVAIGMSINPADIVANLGAIAALVVVVVAGKLGGVTVGAFLAGNGLARSLSAGMSLGQIGEFSFIIVNLGVASGLAGGHLLPVVVAVSSVTALTTPWMLRLSSRASVWADRKLPPRLAAFVSFYGSWIDGIRVAPRRDSLWSRLERPLVLLVIDAALLGATVVTAATATPRLVAELGERLAIEPSLARGAIVVAATVVAALFLVGVLRCARRLARTLAAEVLPPSPQGKLDLGTAPRRVLVSTLELAVVLVTGLPLVAVIQPFVPAGVVALGIVVGMIGFAIWRSVANFQGHVRAGSELIVETLARQSRAAPPELGEIKALLPGIPGLSPVRLNLASPAVGRSLSDVNLRALTGATVLAIHRESGGAVLPTAGEVLRAGDVLALAGTREAIDAAERLLVG